MAQYKSFIIIFILNIEYFLFLFSFICFGNGRYEDPSAARIWRCLFHVCQET